MKILSAPLMNKRMDNSPNPHCSCWRVRWLHSTPLIRHYCDLIMGAVASQITSRTIVKPTVHSGTDQRKHQSSASLAFVRGIHRWPMNSSHKVTRKMFPFDDVIMVPQIRGLAATECTERLGECRWMELHKNSVTVVLLHVCYHRIGGNTGRFCLNGYLYQAYTWI